MYFSLIRLMGFRSPVSILFKRATTSALRGSNGCLTSFFEQEHNRIVPVRMNSIECFILPVLGFTKVIFKRGRLVTKPVKTGRRMVHRMQLQSFDITLSSSTRA